jgi:imidazolonepropionase-like amidohydrolase
VHEELRLLTSEGLTPLEALRAATFGAAVFFGKSDTEGTVERGKVAELVLLNANPLEDIANARKIDTVITGGRIFRKPVLEELLRAAEAAARA